MLSFVNPFLKLIHPIIKYPAIDQDYIRRTKKSGRDELCRSVIISPYCPFLPVLGLAAMSPNSPTDSRSTKSIALES